MIGCSSGQLFSLHMFVISEISEMPDNADSPEKCRVFSSILHFAR
jgi:hypothetical protein